jgi:predicted metalloprotease with PDZ domain
MTEPNPLPPPPSIPAPRDIAYPGVITLEVDATDVRRGIIRARQSLPVAQAGPQVLMFPKWLPGYHSPAAPIELLAGLRIAALGEDLAWRRDPVEVYAFHVDVPAGAQALEIELQFLTPTAQSQGDVVVTPDLQALRWNTVLLYPAGYFARRVQVQAEVQLPRDWAFACALEPIAPGEARFKPVGLDVLVDSPLFAGQCFRRIPLDDDGAVALNLFSDRPDQLDVTDAQIDAHRALVVQADRLFGGRPFERYDFLLALSGALGGMGVEHHCSCEIATPPDYFSAWETNASRRDVAAHEYVHAWNGKHRRGADSWTASFEQPIRNSLMWVYEGQTQYWGQVLAARSGLWTRQQALDSLAVTAAVYANRAGGRWRPMSDTTRDPIIASRQPLPWLSWQRSEDYYSEGQLLWLEIDTLLRELFGETASLDGFARTFFAPAMNEVTRTYRFDDVVAALSDLAPYDWAGLLIERLESREAGTHLEGLTRGGYQLVYRDTPTPFAAQADALSDIVNLRFSLGLAVNAAGLVQEVMWESPAFQAGLTAGASILAVNGRDFSIDAIWRAVAATRQDAPLVLRVKRGLHHEDLRLDYDGGHRFPHLDPVPGARRRLDGILAAL